MKATRNCTIILELKEHEAIDLYLHLNPKHYPNCCNDIKQEIRNALGYNPEDTEVDI